jgi:hypothetical protein
VWYTYEGIYHFKISIQRKNGLQILCKNSACHGILIENAILNFMKEMLKTNPTSNEKMGKLLQQIHFPSPKTD